MNDQHKNMRHKDFNLETQMGKTTNIFLYNPIILQSILYLQLKETHIPYLFNNN